jgi:hypothetical protein
MNREITPPVVEEIPPLQVTDEISVKEAQTLTEALKKVSDEAKERLDEFEKLNAQREIENQESEADDENKKSSALPFIICGAVIIAGGIFAYKKYKNSVNTPVQV